jgi:hypothetical protein
MSVVAVGELGHDVLKLAPVEDQHPVEALPTHRADDGWRRWDSNS